MSGEDRDLGTVFKNPGGVELDEGLRMGLAKGILWVIAAISVGVIVAHGISDSKGFTEAFELIKIGALPLVTLVISFYFPKSH
jgi:hypothetical protein